MLLRKQMVKLFRRFERDFAVHNRIEVSRLNPQLCLQYPNISCYSVKS
jgi:hypothetical protein